MIIPGLKKSITEPAFKMWFLYALMGFGFLARMTPTEFDDMVVAWLGSDAGYQEILKLAEQWGVVTPVAGTPIPTTNLYRFNNAVSQLLHSAPT